MRGPKNVKDRIGWSTSGLKMCIKGIMTDNSLAHTIEIKQSEAIKNVLIKDYQFKEKLGKAWLEWIKGHTICIFYFLKISSYNFSPIYFTINGPSLQVKHGY